MTPHPKFSIITPSMNQARFLEENILSVLAQQYPDVEHIIIDGGSTDATLDILKKYPHLRWVSEPDRGQSHALNKGFKMATGGIVGWLNADDTYCPNALTLVASAFERTGVMVVYGDGNEMDERGRVQRVRKTRGISSDSFIKYWKWKYEYTQPAVFFRKDVFDSVGFLDERLYYVMDHEFFIRLSLHYEFHYIPAVLASFRLHDESKTGQVYKKLLPDSVWELHRVSRRFWGKPSEGKYYAYMLSFAGGLVCSFFKNIFLVKGSKLRTFFRSWM